MQERTLTCRKFEYLASQKKNSYQIHRLAIVGSCPELYIPLWILLDRVFAQVFSDPSSTVKFLKKTRQTKIRWFCLTTEPRCCYSTAVSATNLPIGFRQVHSYYSPLDLHRKIILPSAVDNLRMLSQSGVSFSSREYVSKYPFFGVRWFITFDRNIRYKTHSVSLALYQTNVLRT
jgi:hypothetical protein